MKPVIIILYTITINDKVLVSVILELIISYFTGRLTLTVLGYNVFIHVMKKYELIEHTADIGLKAYGETLSGAFANAALGMFSLMAELENVREAESRYVEVKADDIEGLLFEWLNSLLYYFDVDMLLFSRFDIIEFGDTRLAATCYGEPYDSSRHSLRMGVKSATYHQLEVDKKKNFVRVIFDV